MLHLTDETWVHIGNFLHDFFTGPPMAGLFAVGAALVALHGIQRQVAQTREANRLSKETNETTERAHAETLRKNAEDQWWSTLQWAYSEAKSFKDQNPAETRAVVAILSSLADQPGLSDLQTRTVVEVLGMFKESSDEVVLDTINTTFDSLIPASLRADLDAGKDYERAVGHALNVLAPTFGRLFTGVHVSAPRRKGGHVFDWVLETGDGNLIAIDAKYRSKPVWHSELTGLGAHVGLEVVRWGPGFKGHRITKVLMVTNQDITAPSSEDLLDSGTCDFAAVKWNPEDRYGIIEDALTGLIAEEASSSDMGLQRPYGSTD